MLELLARHPVPLRGDNDKPTRSAAEAATSNQQIAGYRTERRMDNINQHHNIEFAAALLAVRECHAFDDSTTRSHRMTLVTPPRIPLLPAHGLPNCFSRTQLPPWFPQAGYNELLMMQQPSNRFRVLHVSGQPARAAQSHGQLRLFVARQR
jgi:hypothetical protein